MTGFTERGLRVAIGILLWGLVGVITVAFYWELAGEDPVRRVIMVLVSAGLESTKILCWRSGVRSKRVLAVLLVGLSVFASFSSAIHIVQDIRAREASEAENHITQSQPYQSTLREIGSIDQQIELTLGRLAALPPNFVTAANRFHTILAELRTLRSATTDRLDRISLGNSDTGTQRKSSVAVFAILESAFHLSQSFLEVAVLVVLAAAIELSGLALAGQNGDNRSRSYSPSTSRFSIWMRQLLPHEEGTAPQLRGKRGVLPTAADYLQVARELGQGGRLAGYRRVKEALGCSETLARRLLVELKVTGQFVGRSQRQDNLRQMEIP